MSSLDLKDFTLSEKIQLMEALWADLTQRYDQLESPEWHQIILNERFERYKQGNQKMVTLDELNQLFKEK